MKLRIRTLTGAAAALLAAVFTLPGSARADVDLWPLFEKSPERTTILYPLFVKEGEFTMIFPFYYRTDSGRDQHYLWPIAKVSEGRLERLAPVWFSDEAGEFTLFPLISRDERGTTTLIPPMYTRHDGSQRTVVPFYSRSVEAVHDGRRERMSVLWPLWSREVVRDDAGEVVRSTRRALIFADHRDREAGRSLEVLGFAIGEQLD